MSTIYTLTVYIVLVALFSAFMMLLLDRTGVRDTIIMEVPSKVLSELFNCDFCLGFWFSAINSISVSVCTGEPIYLVIPFFSTPITRLLV